MKSFVFFITVLLNALSTGFFFAWSVSVVLGTKKVSDFTYLETMQNINREILNPFFFLVFFGSLITLILNTTLQYNSKLIFWFVLASTILYLIGVFGVTAFGNVPLKDALNNLNTNKLNVVQLINFRIDYEGQWNRFHTIRMVSNMVSFILLLIPIFIKKSF